MNPDPTHCDGCENPGATIRTYVVIDDDEPGASLPAVAETARYCDTCAELGAINWNGTTSAIVSANALWLADDNPDRFTPSDVVDIGNRDLALALFMLPVGGRHEDVERVQ